MEAVRRHHTCISLAQAMTSRVLDSAVPARRSEGAKCGPPGACVTVVCLLGAKHPDVIGNESNTPVVFDSERSEGSPAF